MKIIQREVTNCGTNAGYQAHRHLGQKPCIPCTDARAKYMREYRRRKGITERTLMPLELQCPNCYHHFTNEAAA